ncbi:MAG: hypothetical protein JF625_28060 [Inquilinus limosus]|uniref:HNH endonuclease 5 domain-containing protein n=1 Tax=Inquilinus limosus TaxID=171674 RepID=A0A952KI12_9PROT|nr:hypothetical protein [Inquilinus limosus]
MCEDDKILDGQYEILRQVKACIGDRRVRIGHKGRCRFCGRSRETTFRKLAHTFPEALGNKWVISLDECDDCNEKFSLYENALADSMAPLLTLGGVKGKANKVRQTGRSEGSSVLRRENGVDRPRISVAINGGDFKDAFGFNPSTGEFRLNMPIAGIPFRPRHAFKALCKMAIALLPEADLAQFASLRSWILDPKDSVDFPFLDVGISMASIGNAPPFAIGTLLRRTDRSNPIPYMLFLFCAGSICLQIDLMSDGLDDHVPPIQMGAVNIRWGTIIADDTGCEAIKIDYGTPIHLNWSSLTTQPQPIESVILDFDPRTTQGRFTPVLRPNLQ